MDASVNSLEKSEHFSLDVQEKLEFNTIFPDVLREIKPLLDIPGEELGSTSPSSPLEPLDSAANFNCLQEQTSKMVW